MRVCIWWQGASGASGGGNSFLRLLGDELKKLDVEVVSRPSPDDDIVLINAWNLAPSRFNTPGRVREVQVRGGTSILGRVLPGWVWRGRRAQTKFVHRLDGVAAVYRAEGGRADREQFAINPLCDFTIFQSEFSKQCFADFGSNPDPYEIIPNGVDTTVFYPSKKSAPGKVLKIGASSWSNNRNKGFTEIAELADLPGVEVHFWGNWPSDIADTGVIHHGVSNREEMAKGYRELDAFIHASLNESCSNSLLEALASGLPTIYVDSGSNKQLAGNFGVELKCNTQTALEELLSTYASLKNRLTDSHDLFSVKHAALAYKTSFEALI